MTEDKKKVVKIAKAAAEGLVFIGNPTAGAVWLVSKAVDSFLTDSTEQLAKSGSSEQTRAIAEKQVLAVDLMQRRAHAAQELALAYRMASADEVEVEEHYDGSGEGFLGLDAKADPKTETLGGSLGIKGTGRIMQKRVIRLKGWTDGEAPMEWVQQNLVEDPQGDEPSEPSSE